MGQLLCPNLGLGCNIRQFVLCLPASKNKKVSARMHVEHATISPEGASSGVWQRKASPRVTIHSIMSCTRMQMLAPKGKTLEAPAWRSKEQCIAC